MKIFLYLMIVITFCLNSFCENSIMQSVTLEVTVESTSDICEIKAKATGVAILNGSQSWLNLKAYSWHSLYNVLNKQKQGTLWVREQHTFVEPITRTTTKIIDGKIIDFNGHAYTTDYIAPNQDRIDAVEVIVTASCPDSDVDGDHIKDSLDPCPTDPDPMCSVEPDPDPNSGGSGGNTGVISTQNDSETPDDQDYFWGGIVRYKPWNELVEASSSSTITGLVPDGKTEGDEVLNPLSIITPGTTFFDLLLVKSDLSKPINYGTFSDPRKEYKDERRVLKRLSLKDYGVLFRDSNGDMKLDDLAEAKIFSEEELLKISLDVPNSLYRLILFDIDFLGGNSNGVIDPYDDIWDELFVWFDLNEDGNVDELEIQHVSMLGFTSIGIIIGKDEKEQSDDTESCLKIYSGEVHTHSLNSFMINDVR